MGVGTRLQRKNCVNISLPASLIGRNGRIIGAARRAGDLTNQPKLKFNPKVESGGTDRAYVSSLGSCARAERLHSRRAAKFHYTVVMSSTTTTIGLSTMQPIAPRTSPASSLTMTATPTTTPSSTTTPRSTKRKRTETPEDSGPESQPRKARDGPKKKKANRACK